MLPAEGGVTVRMYRQGLGDCFLLCFRKADGKPFYLMIDCGVIVGTPLEQQAKIRDVARNIAEETGGRIDVLAITHEHWDHVSGFHTTQAQDIFAKITFDTLWFAWTEEPRNQVADDLREYKAKSRKALAKIVEKLHATPGANHGLAGRVLGLLGFLGMEGDLGASGDRLREAMDWIKKRPADVDKIRYHHPGDGPFTLPGVKGLRFYILGPPEDERIIRKLDASSGLYTMQLAAARAVETSLFAAMGVRTGMEEETQEQLDEAKALTQPFEDSFKVKPALAASDRFFIDHYGFSDDDEEAATAWRRIDSDWIEAAGELALQLDSYTNNTSLAFAIELGETPGTGKVLLFPGDAQLGNWLSWFGKVGDAGKEMAWPVASSDRPVTAEDLLRRTVLYKVGHHGSHNATLRERGLQLMGGIEGSPEFVAMLPVDEHIAHEVKHWNRMPLESLVTDLLVRTKGRVMRVDADAKQDDTNPTLKLCRDRAPERPPWDQQPLYFEHRIDAGG